MNKQELISVIIPIYNVEKYISACLDSVVSQTYHDLEIILVDDGSPDNCPALCDQWAAQDPRIVVYHKPNGGLSDARNYGAARAKGKYIAFVDSDDCVAPDYIELLYQPILEHNADMSCCGFVEFENDPCCFPENGSETAELLGGKQACGQMLAPGNVFLIVACAKLIRADLVRQYPFPTGRTHEDEATTCKYFYSSETAAISHHRSYGYRQRAQSITHQKRDKLNEDAAWCMFHRAEWLLEQGDADLAQKAWRSLLYFILGDSVEHDRRSDILLKDAFKYAMQKVTLSKKDTIKFLIYFSFPDLTVRYLQKKSEKAEKNKEYRMTEAIKAPLRLLRDRFVLSGIFLRGFWNYAVRRRKSVYFISTPVHGNLGDHAIVYAQYQILASIGAAGNVIEITRPRYERLREHLAKMIRPDDVILIDGGGNIGTLWLEEEYKMRDIIRRFPQNPIFIFPQTAYFEESEEGLRELEASREVYSGHPKLTVFCRDQVTFDLFEQQFKAVRHILTPDIVPYIQNAAPAEHSRSGVLLCLRGDREKASAPDLQKRMEALCARHRRQVGETSTLYDGCVRKRERERLLRMKWAEFSSAELVVTDRLHGMIFCAITGTPCLALDNLSHKVRDGHVWLKHLPYLRFCQSLEEAEKQFPAMLGVSKTGYDRTPLDPYYQMIQEELKRVLS